MIDWPCAIQYLTIIMTTLAIVYHDPILLVISIVLSFILFVYVPYYFNYYEDDDD